MAVSVRPPPIHIRAEVSGVDLRDPTEGQVKDITGLLLDRIAHLPEFQARLKWERDSIAFWDNRCTQHYAVADYFPRPRLMQRVTIAGDRPTI